MRHAFQKFIIAIIAILIVVEPFLQLTQFNVAKAQDASDTTVIEEEPVSDVPYDGSSIGSQPASIDSVAINIALTARPKLAGAESIINDFAGIHSDDDQKAGIGLDEAISNQVEPRIVLNADDQQALKILWRMSGAWMMPDFEREPQAIFEQYPKFKSKFITEKKDVYDRINTALGHEISSLDDVAALKVKDYAAFLDIVQYAKIQWTAGLGDVATEMRKQTDSAIAAKSFPDSKIIETIADVTGESVENINSIFADNANPPAGESEAGTAIKAKYTNLMDSFSEQIKAIKIDIRVVNLLVYLVTPKTQGGAGHWRIKVKRILSGYTSPKKTQTRESDILYQNAGTNSIDTNSNSDTAASIGQGADKTVSNTTPISQLNTSSSTMAEPDDPNADAIVYDQDGQDYNAFVDSALAADTTDSSTATTTTTTEEKNISAHADGQAVDISEVDDIRCTLIKKRRVGGYSRSKFNQRPIKLAWQTEKGYAESGAGNYYKADMANVLKGFASDGIKDIVNEFGGDVTNYNGDLSNSSFSDIALLLGQSLFSQVINSPDASLKGYNFGDTLEKLGGMYLADYLGLPRDMFATGHKYDTYDDLTGAIGAAAIEKRLDLPPGTFEGKNLSEMLQKVGQHKFEYEMNLDPGSLDNYFKDIATDKTNIENKDYLVGKAVIEKELSLPKGSFTGRNNTPPVTFAELKTSLGEIKANLTFKDPIYADNMLHIDLGTTETLVKGSISPFAYASLVGRTRLDATAYGTQYLAAKDASYELDPGTFEKALEGDANALVQIGIKMMAKVFMTTSDERLAFTTWVNANLLKDPANSNSCAYDDPVKVAINAGTPEAKEITLPEKRATDVGLQSGDLYEMFACPQSTPQAALQTVGSTIIYNAMIQQYLTPGEKVKFNLTEINPQFHSSDPEKQFYVTRAYKIPTLLGRIKNNWKDGNKDPQYVAVKKVVDDAESNIKTIFDASMPIVSIDQAKKAARNMAVAVSKLSSDITALNSGTDRYVNKINGTLIDISELVRTVSEIIAGKVIPATDNITLNQIPSLSDNFTGNLQSLNKPANSAASNSSLAGIGANSSVLMALFARKIKPKDFFIILAAGRMEASLELPQNSLVYFVQNYEKRGLDTVEAFYTAVGQAKIEESFNMPSNYFQGMFISDAALYKPDFRNDMRALYFYGKDDVESKVAPITVASSGGPLKAYALDKVTLDSHSTIKNPWQTFQAKTIDYSTFDVSADPATLAQDQRDTLTEEHYIAGLSFLKSNDPDAFNYIVERAGQRYNDQIQQFISSLNITDRDLETSIQDVADNVEAHKLNDALRTPEQDLLFRMGISGSLDALKTGNSVAWASANGRANQIDRLLGLSQGSTKSLFTGEHFDLGYGADRLSTKDKQILVAKMQISPTALDKLLSFLSGEIPLSELEAKADDITSVGDNPYVGSSSDTCDGPSFLPDAVTGQLTSGRLVSNSWFYYDQQIPARIQGGHLVFASQVAAESYREGHANDQGSYIDELAYGLSNITGIGAGSLKPNIESFLRGDSDTALNLSGDGPATLEANMGVSTGTLKKLFVKEEASAVDKPLVAYKKAVGRKVTNQVLTSKLFSAFGLRLDPSLFTGNEFFEIMHGNFSGLMGVAGAAIDQNLNIPRGSTMSILTAKSGDLRQCALAEIGGSIIGKYVGLNYVSLKGNIYENIGRSRLETTLDLPRNSFSGKTIDDLINNVGVVNFYIAFQYPVGNVDLNSALNAFYDPVYARTIMGYSDQFKLKKIKDFLDINSSSALSGARLDAYIALKNALNQRIKETADKALMPNGDWRKGEYGADATKKDAIIQYLTRVDSIDNSFGITKGTTAKFIYGKGEENIEKTQQFACGIKEDGTPVPDPDGGSRVRWDDCNDSDPAWHDTLNVRNPDGSILKTVAAPKNTCTCDMENDPAISVVYSTYRAALTPDEYIKKISNKSLLGLAALSALDLFGIDMSDAQKQATVGFLTHYNNWSQSNTGRAKIYDSLSTIFSLHLDAKAGFDEGTIRQLIANPKNASDILWPQAARLIDRQLGLNPSDKWSISGVYARYFNHSADFTLSQENKTDECGPEQAALDAKEAELANRQKAVTDWINLHGGYLDLAVEGNPNDPDYNAMMGEQTAINQARNDLQRQKQTCKAGNRGGGTTTNQITNFTDQNGVKHNTISWATGWTILTDFASDKIHDAIWNATKFTVDMPPEDVKHFFVNGDMRYFNALLTTYTANTIINKLTGNQEAVPRSMQISYDMIKLWFVGDTGAEDYGANAAANRYLNPPVDQPADSSSDPDLNNSSVSNAFGDISDDESGTIWGTITSPNYNTNTENLNQAANNTSRTDLVHFSQQQSLVSYGNFDPAATQADIDALNNEANNCQGFLNSVAGQDYDSLSDTEKAGFDKCNTTMEQRGGMNKEMQSAREQVRDSFKKQAQYRMLDATLWSKDHNVFPGFSYALFEGDSRQKNQAIGLYLKNGLINGEFFGHTIGFMKNIEANTSLNLQEWALIVDWGINLAGSTPADQVLLKFQKNGGVDALAKFISLHSDNWFGGFKIDTDYAKGLITGLTTGHWGISLGNRTYTNPADPNGSYPTLGSVFAAKVGERMAAKAFSWADRQMGSKAGTAYQIYTTTRQILTALDNYRKIVKYSKIVNDAQKLAQFKTNYPGVMKLIDDNKGDTKAAASSQLHLVGDMIVKYASQAIMKWIQTQAGQEIAKFEDDFGLVPGSSTILISTGVTYGVNALLYNLFPNSGLFSMLGPGALYGAIAMFIGVNLFGFYKSELSCSADGYYPEIGSPSMTADSNSGLAPWNGMDENAAKQNTVASAQYKAKRLILDVLEMHKNPIYKDTYASQIMTGRNEDVLAVNDSINENMCSVIGLVSIAGICGGNTRAGVWENLQTTTYTHIGF